MTPQWRSRPRVATTDAPIWQRGNGVRETFCLYFNDNDTNNDNNNNNNNYDNYNNNDNYNNDNDNNDNDNNNNDNNK